VFAIIIIMLKISIWVLDNYLEVKKSKLDASV
jgi:hypothetical protein